MEKAILEIHAGEGGTDSKLFAKDMVKMYTSYSAKKGWEVECL
jgi:protein subunit release factor A